MLTGSMSRSLQVVALALVLAGFALGAGELGRARGAMVASTRSAQPGEVLSFSDEEPLELPPHIARILAGGGPTPDLDQVSLEEDVALAQRMLDDEGTIVLFAGGAGTRAVQERDPSPEGDPVVFALGNLFAPRGGRDAHYRRTRLSLHGGASVDEIFAALEIALPDGDDPLFFYFTGHGRGGASPADALVQTWGNAGFDPPMLAEQLEDVGTSRRVRVVVTSCFSGGFAELAFRSADETLGPTDQDRCGIFSTSWDREAGGCDSDTDRTVHEGFGVYFLSALGGRDRDGHDARARIDRDHDGTITLLEALAEVRIASRAIDVPVTTSERLLRSLAPEEGEAGEVSLPEEAAVIDALLASLDLDSVEAAQRSLEMLQAREEENTDALAEAYAEADDRAAEVAGAVLSRWPVLDDPYHPDYPAMLHDAHDELAEFFASEEAIAWADAEDDASALQTANDGLEVQIAVHLRVLWAAETLALAGRLSARGGSSWDRFQEMRACEASPP